jgi:hypothetical protein
MLQMGTGHHAKYWTRSSEIRMFIYNFYNRLTCRFIVWHYQGKIQWKLHLGIWNPWSGKNCGRKRVEAQFGSHLLDGDRWTLVFSWEYEDVRANPLTTAGIIRKEKKKAKAENSEGPKLHIFLLFLRFCCYLECTLECQWRNWLACGTSTECTW